MDNCSTNHNNSIPPLVLAPMSDLTCAPFRQLVAELKGCQLFYTEMLNIRIISSCNLKNDPFLIKGDLDSPLIAQLIGNDPERIREAVLRLSDMGFDGFDINMGCSRQAIIRHGWGLALFENQVQAVKVIEAARNATQLPVSVKIRSGASHSPELMIKKVKTFIEAGIDGITLHPRTQKDGFKRPARWEEIRFLKQEVNIPVTGNGDIACRTDAINMFDSTGCDAIMIGRAAVIRPWIFREIKEDSPPGTDPLTVLDRAAYLYDTLLPQEIAPKKFCIFLSWYLRNWPFHQYILKKMKRHGKISSILKSIRGLLSTQKTIIKGKAFIERF